MDRKHVSDEAAIRKIDRRLFFGTMAAHGGALVCCKIASAPLERIKICRQVLPRTAQSSHLECVRWILASQGVGSWWRGSAAHIGGISLGVCSRLSVLKTTQMWAMPGTLSDNDQYGPFEAYARRCAYLYTAGATALCVAYPLDVAYTNLAADMQQPRRFRSAWHFFSTVRRTHGILSLYRGLSLALLTAAPFIAVSTAAHDAIGARVLRSMGQSDEPVVTKAAQVQPGLSRDRALPVVVGAGPVANLAVGALSGFVAQTVTYPLDTVRRRWQYACSLGPGTTPGSYKDCLMSIWRQGGWRALYAGYAVNTAKLAPELAVLSGVYLQINSMSSFI